MRGKCRTYVNFQQTCYTFSNHLFRHKYREAKIFAGVTFLNRNIGSNLEKAYNAVWVAS